MEAILYLQSISFKLDINDFKKNILRVLQASTGKTTNNKSKFYLTVNAGKTE